MYPVFSISLRFLLCGFDITSTIYLKDIKRSSMNKNDLKSDHKLSFYLACDLVLTKVILVVY